MSKEKGKKKNDGDAPQYRWILRIFLIAVALSAALSLASESALTGAGIVAALLVLAGFICLGILFDITAADERPFHSMAAHKEPGASEAISLLRNASHVSSFCNDVVGDICGIVSGTTAAVIVVQLQQMLTVHTVLLSVGVTALISGLTIGGKALGKTLAINKSTRVVFLAGRFLHIFHRFSK